MTACQLKQPRFVVEGIKTGIAAWVLMHCLAVEIFQAQEGADWNCASMPQLIRSSSQGPLVTTVADLDNDGSRDVLLAHYVGHVLPPPNAKAVDTGVGTITLVSAVSGSAISTFFFEGIDGGRNGCFGSSVSTCGDIDGNGTPDVVIAASCPYVTEHPSSLHLFDLTSAKAFRQPSGIGGNRMLLDCEILDDLNNDGCSEYAVVSADSNGMHARCDILSGRDDSVVYSLLRGHSVTAIARLGDIDRDGVGDLAICVLKDAGAKWYSESVLHVYSGATAALIRKHAELSLSAEVDRSIDTIGDIDGDGVPEYAVGDCAIARATGQVQVFDGASGVLARTLLPGNYVREAEAVGSYFGYAVSGVGDVDGDGVPDIGIGAPSFLRMKPERLPERRAAPGYFVLVSGRNYESLMVARGCETKVGDVEALGVSVCGSTDVNGDGRADVFVGADRYYQVFPANADVVKVYSLHSAR